VLVKQLLLSKKRKKEDGDFERRRKYNVVLFITAN
jgi:hypothetical protein